MLIRGPEEVVLATARAAVAAINMVPHEAPLPAAVAEVVAAAVQVAVTEAASVLMLPLRFS